MAEHGLSRTSETVTPETEMYFRLYQQGRFEAETTGISQLPSKWLWQGF